MRLVSLQREKSNQIGNDAKQRLWEERAVCKGGMILLNTRRRHKDRLMRRQQGKRGISHVERTIANKASVRIMTLRNSIHSAAQCIDTSLRIRWFACILAGRLWVQFPFCWMDYVVWSRLLLQTGAGVLGGPGWQWPPHGRGIF